MAVQAVKSITNASSELVLHPRLLNFFARFPPRLYGVHFTGDRIVSLKERIAIQGDKKTGAPPTATAPPKSIPYTESSSSSQPIIQSEATSTEAPSAASSSPVTISSSSSSQVPPLIDPETSDPILDPAASSLEPNPFLPYKNPATGRWRGPRISLRRQAELFKIARLYGVEPLLPPSRKATAFKEARILERGLAVKGTGEGQKVKGHKWEREMGGMLQKRIEAMEKMPGLVREWRQRGNGRGWKKYPR